MLMPYTYTLAWEAKKYRLTANEIAVDTLPERQSNAFVKTAGQFLWGRDLLIAPVYEKGAKSRKVYLPEGAWYDWWTNTRQSERPVHSQGGGSFDYADLCTGRCDHSSWDPLHVSTQTNP